MYLYLIIDSKSKEILEIKPGDEDINFRVGTDLEGFGDLKDYIVLDIKLKEFEGYELILKIVKVAKKERLVL